MVHIEDDEDDEDDGDDSGTTTTTTETSCHLHLPHHPRQLQTWLLHHHLPRLNSRTTVEMVLLVSQGLEVRALLVVELVLMMTRRCWWRQR